MNAVASSQVSHAWINLATFDRTPAAERLREWLSHEGIEARIQDERGLQRRWFLARPLAGVHVRVPETAFAQAQQLVETDPAAARLMEGAIRCPSCHSVRVQFPQMTRRNILPTLVAQVLVLTHVMHQE